MNTWEEVNKILEQEFSPEITDEEAILFFHAHPNSNWSALLLIGYKIERACGKSPYESLKYTMKSYIKVMEE